jgi:hypothetical protein
MRALKRLLLGLAILAAVCTSAVFFSCKRLPPKGVPGPRNLTPGLSEALIALARRHPNAGFTLWLRDRSGNSVETKNLAALMEKAFKVGGWKVVSWKVVRNDVKSDPIHGLYCSYGRSKEQAATELISVLEQKGLLIKGFMHDDDPALGRGGDPMIVLEVGLNQ